MEDTEIQCSVCQRPFLFSAAEQAYYAQRGFQFPKRCRECRQARRRGGTSQRLSSTPKQVAHVPRMTFQGKCVACEDEVELVFPPTDREVTCATCFGARLGR